MKTTLLAGPVGTAWKPFLRDRPGSHLILDPASSDFGPPGRAVLAVDGRQAGWRFVGSLEATRRPLSLVVALEALTRQAEGPELWVQLFPLRPVPLARQLALACAQMLRPASVLVPRGSGLEGLGWPVGAEEADLEKAPPAAVSLAQRKARWIELWDKGDLHEVAWPEVQLEGCRLGSGHSLEAKGGVWAEKQGAVLFAVSPEPLAGPELGRLMESSGATKAAFASPQDYLGLLCAFASQEGEDFALGVIQGVDLAKRVFRIRSKAAAPAPVRVLRMGSLKINRAGVESDDLQPWAL